MSRPKRFSVSLDGDPRGQSCSRSLVPMLLLTSLFFASSAAVLSCPADGGPCSPMDLRAALNRSRQSFATCDAAAQPPSQTPPGGTQPDPAEAAADPAAMRSEEFAKPPVAEYAEMRMARSADLPDVAAAAAAAAEPAPQIATFDEWTKAKLQQPPPVIVVVAGGAEGAPAGATAPHAAPETPRVLVAVPPLPTHPAAATRNYASRECGAKVIYSNPEAENTKAVLNDKEKDDYMRNPCDKAQHKHIVIELCETIQPRSIEIANFELFSSGPASVRFSAAERFPTQQWSVLGEWSLADTRTVQTLPVAADALTYAKFIKLELLAHHGAEHFCTLSTVRVLGVSMVDEYEAEAAVAARIAAPHAAVPPLAATEAVVTPPVQPTQPKEQQQVKKEDPISTAVPTEPTPITSTEAPPIAVVEPPPVAPRPPATDASPPPSGSGLVQEVMSGTLLKKIIEVVGGRKKTAATPAAPPRLSAYDACDRTPTDGWPRATCARRAFFCPPGTSPAPAPTRPTAAEETAAKRAAARRQFIAATQREEAARAAAAAPTPQLPPTQIDAPPQRKATTTPVVQPQAAAPPPPAAEAAPKEAEPPVAAAKPPQQEQQPPPAAAAPQAAQQQQAAPPVGIFEGLPAGTNSHKLETIFIKLTKRVSALELNMSLSSEYLSELSKQYIAHTDEQKRAMERTRVAAERAALDVARTVNETVRDELFNLRKEVDALSAWLATLRAQAGSVALTRRISGAYAASQDGHHETSPAEERLSSSAEVGHHRRHQQSTVDIGGEDYASYDDTYESTCPYSEAGGRRQQQGRAYGPQPRPPREPNASDADDGEEEECGHADADDAFDLRHFRHHSDGIWTTEQVLYAVLGAQALTVALVLLMQACYARAFGRPRRPADPPAPAAAPDTAELERLIAAALERRAEREAAAPPRDPAAAAAAAASADASPRSSASSTASSSGAAAQPLQQLSGSKKKRRQRRSTAEQQQQQQQQQQNHHHCRQCGEGQNLDWDSAMDSSLPSPSQTGSEEEFEAPPPSAGSAPSSPQAASGSSVAKPESV